MGKFTTYITIMTGLMLLFYLGGLLQGTASSTLLDMLLNPQNMANLSLTLRVVAAITALALVGIAVGGFAIAGNLDLLATGTISIFLLSLLWDFLVVFNRISAANPVIALILFGPLIFLWVITVWDWTRGRD